MKDESKLTDCALKLHRNDIAYRKADVADFIVTFIMVIVAVFAFRAFMFEPVRVAGTSMVPTLQDTERMFVEKFTYWFDAPSRGDIVICKYPSTYTPGKPTDTYVKRVIGLPGETIRILDGRVEIKAPESSEFVPLNEYSYLGDMFINGDFPRTNTEQGYIVPDDCVFVMGDNRNNSTDSRDPRVNAIKITEVIGKVHGVVYPLDSIRNLEGINYDG
ncbi:MAG: signal peptidase I [Clostridia bacterium]|nr:signal peptidase I [Clostridia bacterium]